MPGSSSPLRTAFSVLILIVLGYVVLIQVRQLLNDPTVFPPDDYVEYWAAGRLNLQGQNPYSPELLLPLELQAGRKTDEAIMMWNPPWTLTFVMPIGALEARTGQLLWTLLNLILIVGCSDWLWQMYQGPTRFRWVSWVLALTYMPTLFLLGAGQIGAWILLGIVLFLEFERRGWHYLAGGAGVLMAIKPHLMYLFWPTLALLAFRGWWRVVLGGIGFGLLATAIPMLFNPDVLKQYYEEITQRPPQQWLSPTLGTVIRLIVVEGLERETFAIQFIPPAIGLLLLMGIGRKWLQETWQWPERLPLLLLISFVTAAYGAWPFDLVILLPVLIQVATQIANDGRRKRVQQGILAFILLNLPALILNLFKIGSFWFIWMAPLMLILYLLLYQPSQPRKSELSTNL